MKNTEGRMLKSSLRKRSITLNGGKTSVSLEDGFWDVIQEAATARGVSCSALVSEINGKRTDGCLSSACRLFALDFVKARSAIRVKATDDNTASAEPLAGVDLRGWESR